MPKTPVTDDMDFQPEESQDKPQINAQQVILRDPVSAARKVETSYHIATQRLEFEGLREANAAALRLSQMLLENQRRSTGSRDDMLLELGESRGKIKRLKKRVAELEGAKKELEETQESAGMMLIEGIGSISQIFSQAGPKMLSQRALYKALRSVKGPDGQPVTQEQARSYLLGVADLIDAWKDPA